MDILFEAARTGNVGELQGIIRENPLILDYVAMESRENPLHLACLFGHLDFARELLILRPEFAKKLSPYGYSPLHMAAANGRVEIVKELIRFDQELCHMKGRDMMTPLHSATQAGEIGVINEMLLVCPESIEDVTIQGETCLHLAVKSSQYDSLDVLADWIRKMGKEEIMNVHDEQDNTVPSLAMQMKERRFFLGLSGVPLSLGQGYPHLDPPDSAVAEPHWVNDDDDEKMQALRLLMSIGNMETRDRVHECEYLASSSHDSTRRTNSSDYFQFQKGRDSPSDARTALLVIAVLVATATYQVGLSPPGGTWQDNNNNNNMANNSADPIAGTSIMGTYDGVGFIFMIGLNSIGFSVSLSMIGMLTSKFPLRAELLICITALYTTYSTAVNSISPVQVRVISIVFTSVLPTLVPLSMHLMRKYLGPMMAPMGRRLIKYKVVRALADYYG